MNIGPDLNLNNQRHQLTERAAARITKEFKIPEKQRELFGLVANCKRRYETYLRTKDYHQRKQILEQVSKSFGNAAIAAAKLRHSFDDLASDRMLYITGSLLSKKGLEQLIGHSLTLPRESSEALGEVARQVGPNLIVFLLDALRQPVDEALALYRLHTGGRPRKNFYRDFVIQELGRNYSRLFGELPRNSRTGRFARFCAAVLEELQCELEGYDRTFPVLLKAIGVLKPRQRP